MELVTTTETANALTSTEHDKSDGSLSLLGEIQSLNQILEACVDSANPKQIVIIVEAINALRIAQSKFESESFERELVLSLAELFHSDLKQQCNEFDVEAATSELKLLLGIQDTQPAERNSLDDLRLLRRLIRANPDAATIVAVSQSIKRVIKTAVELGLSSGDLMSEQAVCQHIKTFITTAKNHFPPSLSVDHVGEIIDSAAQRISQTLKGKKQ